MRTRISVLAGCAALALLGSGCGGSKSSTPTTPSNNSQVTTITIPSSDGYGSSSFSPGSVTVPAGRTVVWSNKDSVVHTSTSDSGLWSGSINAGGEFSRTFSTRGSFSYRCTLHEGMSGTVTVE